MEENTDIVIFSENCRFLPIIAQVLMRPGQVGFKDTTRVFSDNKICCFKAQNPQSPGKKQIIPPRNRKNKLGFSLPG